jgi:hypothetical protein
MYLKGTGGLVIEADVPPLGQEILLLVLSELHGDLVLATTEFLERNKTLERPLSPGNGMAR